MMFWRRNSWLRDSIVWMVCVSITVTPFVAMLPTAYADEIIDEANKGQDTGANLLLNYQVPGISHAPPNDPLGANELSIQELFPGFDPSDPTQLSTLTDLANTPADLSTQGFAQQFSLQGGADINSEAYQSIRDGSNNPHYGSIDLRNDNFLDRSREIISGNDPILDEILTACAEDVTAGDPGTDVVTRLEDIYTCSQLRTGLSGACTVDRDFVLVPVATQIVLAVVGGTCVPTPAASGRDRSDWQAAWGSVAWTPVSGPAQYCRTIGSSPELGYWMTGTSAGQPVFHFPYFCGEFDTAVPSSSECGGLARRMEHACRNAEPAWVATQEFVIRESSVLDGPHGECATYNPGNVMSFPDGVAVDYTGCDADRQNYCTQVYDYYVAECTRAPGDDCGAGPCGTGLDLSDHSAGGWFAYTYAAEPACWRTQPAAAHENWNGNPYPEAWIRLDNAALPGFPGWLTTNYCGEFDTDNPTTASCSDAGSIFEHICRNAPGNTGGPGHSGQLNPNMGATGSCSSYSFDPTGALYTAGTPVDYTGCTAARQTYCEARRAEFEGECGGACSGGGGGGAEHWSDFFGAPLAGEIGACRVRRLEPFNGDWSDLPAFDGMTMHRRAEWQPGEPRDDDERIWVGFYCGTHQGRTPAEIEQACNTSADHIESLCRNTVGNGAFTALGQIHTFDPGGPGQGNCSPWTEAGPPFTYAGCPVGRLATCRMHRQTHFDACMGVDTCEAETNIPLYDNLSTTPNNAGPIEPCRTTRAMFNYTNPGMESFPEPMSFAGRETVSPDPWGDHIVLGISTNACGDQLQPDCAASAQNFEDTCNGSLGPAWQMFGPSGPSFPPPDSAYCASQADIYEANCHAANACLSGGSVVTLNGTETITSPGLGPGVIEILANQNVFGTTVDFEENAFNPSNYGLAAGEYVVADHTVTGSGIVSSNIDHGGSYGSNWDFTTTLTLANSTGFEVEATLYEIVANGFIFTGCSQADVQNVENGTCSGAITCTDYTPPCRIVDGVTVCEPADASDGITDTLAPWTDFTTAVPEMCWSANVDIIDCVGQTNCIGNPSCVSDCDHLPPELQPACLADACWVDAQGDTVCLDDTSEAWINNLGDPNYVDDCQDLLDDPACELQPEVACIEGMEDPNDPTNIDACLLRQRFFDCGSDVTVPGVPGADDVDVTCGAQIRCFGDECGNTTTESNPDFVRAAVAATTLTESTKDMTCDITGDPSTCTIFEGTDNRCKDPRGSWLGIIPDCCDEARRAGASAGDFVTYMQLARYSFRLARDPIVASWLAQGQALPSGLQNVVNAPANLGRWAGRHISSGFNSALQWAGLDPIAIATDTETMQTAIGASPTGFGPLQQFIAGGVDNFLRSIGADAFADSLFTVDPVDGAITDWASDGLGEMVGSVLDFISFLYTVYNILKILGSLLFPCEEEELAFGIQQVNRACHHVGTYCAKRVRLTPFIKKCVIEMQTYCCFSSPFARIVQEQLRLQGIGPDWGTAKEPNCDGISITELENVDWSLVDLSEWEAILFEAGLVPDPRNPPLNFVPTDRHPGDSTGGNEGATSTEIITETIGIIMPEFDDARFTLEGEGLHQPDPELMPWYDDGG